ncbi:MAG: prolyl oligopeptidase family protein [Microcystaceae cyanobacterium]
MSVTYPFTRQDNQVDTYHGIVVKDPYRWLENPDAEETQNWIKAQNEITFNYLDTIQEREEIKQRLTQLWNYEKYGIPFKEGERYFYFKNDGLQNQSVLYTLESLEDDPQVLLDPNTLSEDGTIALSGLSISKNGQYLAYGVAQSGSDWVEWRVRNIETKEDLTDHIQWVKFSGVSWTHDHQGFFYSRYDAPNPDTKLEETNYYQKLYYHRLGTSQGQDRLVYQRTDQKEWGFNGFVTDDGKYLMISVWQGTDPKRLIFYQNLQQENGPIIELIPEFEANYQLIDNQDSILWFKTDLDAPKSRVIAIDLNQPNQENWQEVIPEAEETLQNVGIVNHQFVVNYLKDAHSVVKLFDLNGQLIKEINFPEIGTVYGFNGQKKDEETFYSFTSFTTPTTIYKYDFTTGKSTLFCQPTVDFNPDDYETKQVFYPSKDGTMIPLCITYKKGLQSNGKNPTYLYGYGGFNVSLTPAFSVSNLVWMERGGIYAVANLRGGGEYGEKWHQAGMKDKKQNVFDDFIAAAEWLIKNNYTSSDKLAIGGGSNGGLLVGACLSQRPDLFGAAIPAVGVMDMLRFHKFTIGWAWCPEYGNPENKADFHTLYAYSPLHNLTENTAYPATLITTADHDDRVVPAHSFKFAAALQLAHNGENPVLIRIETKAGHGAGKPTAKIIEEATDKWAFLTKVLI